MLPNQPPLVDVRFNRLCIHYLVVRIVLAPYWTPVSSIKIFFIHSPCETSAKLPCWKHDKCHQEQSDIQGWNINILWMFITFFEYQHHNPISLKLQGNRPRRSAGREMHRRGVARRAGMPKWKAWHRDQSRSWFVFEAFVWKRTYHHETKNYRRIEEEILKPWNFKVIFRMSYAECLFKIQRYYVWSLQCFMQFVLGSVSVKKTKTYETSSKGGWVLIPDEDDVYMIINHYSILFIFAGVQT